MRQSSIDKLTQERRLGPAQQRYTTRRAHGLFPEGTECWVSRPDSNTLRLEFEGGHVLNLEGNRWYAEGLEDRRVQDASIWLGLGEAIAREIDQEVFAELDRVANLKL